MAKQQTARVDKSTVKTTYKKRNTLKPGERVLIAHINGLDIYTNSRYRISGKIDPKAPDGLQKYGTAAIKPHYVSANFIPRDAEGKLGTWDTGFYMDSPMYASWQDKDGVKKQVDSLNEFIVKPYCELLGEANILNQSNSEFYNDYLIELALNDCFDTSDPVQTLNLWLAMTSCSLMPDGRENDPRFSNAYYMIKDEEKVMERIEEITNYEFKAYELFTELEKTDKAMLVMILNYIGINNTRIDVPVIELQVNLRRYLRGDVNRAKYFCEEFEWALTDEGKTKVELTHKIKQLKLSGAITIGSDNNLNYMGKIKLDRNEKRSADKLYNEKDMSDIMMEILSA